MVKCLFKVTEVKTEPKVVQKEKELHIYLFCQKGKQNLGWRPKPSAGARSSFASRSNLLEV